MRASHQRRQDEDGFTLVEVLLATALLGIMMLLLTGSLRIGADSWEAGEERLAKASRLFIVESFLRKHIASLLPVSGVNKNGEMEPAFRGSPTTLNYVAPLPDQLEGGGLYRFKLYVAGENDNLALRVLIVPYVSDPNQSSKAEPQPLDDLAIVEQVQSVKFAYYGPDPASNSRAAPVGGAPAGKWTENWSDYQLPSLIRIDIEREGEDPWPTVIIAPKTLMLR